MDTLNSALEHLPGAQNLTLEHLPGAFSDFILNEWRPFIKAFQAKQFPAEQEPDRWFDLPGLCEYLPDKPATATVYGWVHESKIPVHKGGKKLRFLKSEIDHWLKIGRSKTNDEAGADADAYIGKKRHLKPEHAVEIRRANEG